MNCPGCGNEMQELGCKQRCGRCGYFEDCSDGMLLTHSEEDRGGRGGKKGELYTLVQIGLAF